MTLEQATQLQTDLNASLIEAGNVSLTYGIFAVWNQQYQKNYNVILYPIEYKTKYEATTTSGQFAVARVSISVQAKGANTAEGFITDFQAAVAKDDEANNVLNK